jgi:predicted ArsR family transcriptional regulator
MRGPQDDIARIAALEDPLRRRLHDFVRSEGRPVSRDEAAHEFGIGRSLAAYHLDKLADEGFLEVSYARPEGRSGPGAGRPAKLYAPAAVEVAVTVPARDYEFAADLFADAAEADASGRVADAVRETARASGRALGEGQRLDTRRALIEALSERGYEPFEDEHGDIRLRNCPFDRLAAEHRDLVCGMNQALLEGLLEGSERTDLVAALEPRPGLCCVAVRDR